MSSNGLTFYDTPHGRVDSLFLESIYDAAKKYEESVGDYPKYLIVDCGKNFQIQGDEVLGMRVVVLAYIPADQMYICSTHPKGD